MDFLKLKVQAENYFKDGNILDGKELHPGDILEVTQAEHDHILQSGGHLVVLETLIPNPKKKAEPPEELVVLPEEQATPEELVVLPEEQATPVEAEETPKASHAKSRKG